MKQKSIILIIIIILLLLGGAYLYYSKSKKQTAYEEFKDDANKVSFKKPTAWVTSSTDGYVRIIQNNTDPSSPSILVKVDYPASIIPALGLDSGQQVTIGKKTMRKADSQIEVPANAERAATTATYTHLLWDSPDGRKIIFEISPWQKPGFDKSVEEFLSSFSPIP